MNNLSSDFDRLIWPGSIRKSKCSGSLQSHNDRWHRRSRFMILPQDHMRCWISLQAAKIVAHIHHEMGLHVEYCKGFGVTKEEIEASEESQGTLIATRTRASLTSSTSMHRVYQVSQALDS
jgi:hypothetical protein